MQIGHIVGDHDDFRPAGFVFQRLLCLTLESRIANRSDFINEKVIEVESHAEREAYTTCHPRGIRVKGFLKIITDPGKLLNLIKMSANLPRVDSIEVGDHFAVLPASQVGDEATAQAEWPGESLVRSNAPGIGMVDAS